MSLKPVALPPGCARFSTNPMATGLPTLTNTMGIEDVCRFVATDAVEPVGTNNAAPRSMRSATALSVSASLPEVQTISSTMSWPSPRPAWRNPRCNAANSGELHSFLHDALPNFGERIEETELEVIIEAELA